MQIFKNNNIIYRLMIFLSGIITSLVIFFVDYKIFGPDITFTLVYLLPIVAVCWYSGLYYAILLSILCVAEWSAIKYHFYLADKDFIIFIINIVTKLLMYNFIIFLSTRLKLNLNEKELILKEVHHRIKNNLNTINGLLSLKQAIVKEPEVIEAIIDVKNRVQNMEVLYDRLYKSPNYNDIPVKEYILSLIDKIIGNFPNSSYIKLETKINELILDAKRTQSMGIIINELLTNIMKYAFTDKKDCLIKVSAFIKDHRIYLIIEDNGQGIPESINFEYSNGMGLKLVEMLTRQLNGTVRIERANGTRITLEFPAGLHARFVC